MERKVWIVSLSAALAGAGLLYWHMQRVEQEARGGPTTRTLVLVRDVPAGTALSREMLGHREVPRAYLESRHVRSRDIDQVLGARLAVSGRAAEALLWTDLAGVREAARSLSMLVPEGMRAVPLALADAGLGTLIAPGDRVDVLLTSAALDGASEAERVAENLLVLSVGGNLGQGSGTGNAQPRAAQRGLTVAASPAQALLLAAAQRRGALHVVLRNPDDLTLTSSSRDTAPRPAMAEAED